MDAFLRIIEPTGSVWDFPLAGGGSYSVGRAKSNDIVLNDRRVSRKHARIVGDASGFSIEDGYIENGELIRSSNRVMVNGAPQLDTRLKTGDVIKIGATRLEFEVGRAYPSETSIRGLDLSSDKLEPEAPVNFDDRPLGGTQMQIPANEIIGHRSHLTLETEVADPAEIKELRRKEKMLELLYEMSKAIGSVFDLKEVFGKATELIFRGTPADRAVALLVEPSGGDDGDVLVPIAVKARSETLDDLTNKLTVSRTITRKVMDERVAVLSQDARTDDQFVGSASIVSQGVRSTICAPLLTESGVHGVIYADRLDPFASFTPDHLKMISAVAAQVALTVETVRAHERLAREEVARANYGRFLPEYVVQQILEDPGSLRLGGVNQYITVLFADIRGFTSISETADPEKIVGLLNRYFSVMTEVIFEYGGMLDKYVGDGLLAIFGAPKVGPDDADNAVRAAIAMQESLADLNKQFVAEGIAPIAVGIGLHTGEATIGYIGSEKRSEYTAIGDTVNLAARLEASAAGGEILISDATSRGIGEDLSLERLEPLTVKNRIRPVNVLRVKWQ